MTGRDAGLVVRALGARLQLDTRQTQYRGHAGKLAAASAADGYDMVVTFSGDGTVNEVVNGLMQVPDPADRPAIAPIPGGGANVFARTLGLPSDAGGAVQRIVESGLDELVVTDTIPLSDAARDCGKIRQLSCASLLGETILRISNAESVSSLFVD